MATPLVTIPTKRGPKPNPGTREAMLRAGVRIFHETGYAAAGIKEIVDAAEVPKGTFYNHFDSKEAFGREVVDFYFNAHIPDLKDVFDDVSLAPLGRLRAYFEALTAGFQATGLQRGCLLGNMSLEVADHSMLIQASLAAHFTTWDRCLETCIAAAQQDGSIKNRQPASLLARFTLNSWEGALVRMRADRSSVPLTEFRDVVFGALLV